MIDCFTPFVTFGFCGSSCPGPISPTTLHGPDDPVSSPVPCDCCVVGAKLLAVRRRPSYGRQSGNPPHSKRPERLGRVGVLPPLGGLPHGGVAVRNGRLQPTGALRGVDEAAS